MDEVVYSFGYASVGVLVINFTLKKFCVNGYFLSWAVHGRAEACIQIGNGSWRLKDLLSDYLTIMKLNDLSWEHTNRWRMPSLLQLESLTLYYAHSLLAKYLVGKLDEVSVDSFLGDGAWVHNFAHDHKCNASRHYLRSRTHLTAKESWQSCRSGLLCIINLYWILLQYDEEDADWQTLVFHLESSS